MKYYLKLSLFAIMVGCSSSAFCQSMASGDALKTMLVNDWLRAKAYTQDYMDVMPKDKYSFRTSDSVRTFAQQMLHIAQANMFLISTAAGEKGNLAQSNLEMSASAQSADSVMYFVNKSYDFAINAVQNLSAESLMQDVSFNMGETLTASRLSWILKAFEHQTHHRGQTTIYIRQLGVKPPNERLFK